MPRRTAVVIGINYNNFPQRAEISPLKYAEADAEDMASLLREDGYQVVKLLGSEATHKSIVSALEKQSRLASREGLFVVHFSGHGDVNPDDQEAYLLPFDADPHYLKATAIPLVLLTSYYDSEVGAAITLLDCCHSGGAVDWRGRAVPANMGQAFRERAEDTFKSMRGRMVLAACASNQKARELDQLQHGAFTHYALKHLAENAKATPNSLHDYIADLLDQTGLPRPVQGGILEGLILLRASTGQLKSVPSAISLSSVQAQQNQDLHKRLNSDLTVTEFRDLCLFLGVLYSSLGRNRREQAHALIKQMESASRIEELKQAVDTALSHKISEQGDKAAKEWQRLSKELRKTNAEIRDLNTRWLVLKLEAQDIISKFQLYWKEARERMDRYAKNERPYRDYSDIHYAITIEQRNNVRPSVQTEHLVKLARDLLQFANQCNEEESRLPCDIAWFRWSTDISVEIDDGDTEELNYVQRELRRNHERREQIDIFRRRASNSSLVRSHQLVLEWARKNPGAQCPQTLIGYLAWLHERQNRVTEPYDKVRECVTAALSYKGSGLSIWGYRQSLQGQYTVLKARRAAIQNAMRAAKSAMQATHEGTRFTQIYASRATNKRTTGRRKP
jgi:hypothetical protein